MKNEKYPQKAKASTRVKLRCDAGAFGNLRVLCFAAMLAAMSVALAYLAKLIFGLGPFRITFENFPIIFGGISFGPFVGAMIAVVADLLSCLLSGQAPNPLISVGSISIGIVAGVLGRYVFARKKWTSLFLVEFFAQFVGSIVLKTWALHTYFGYAWLALLPRVPVYLGIIVAESYLLFAVYKNRHLVSLLERMYQK